MKRYIILCAVLLGFCGKPICADPSEKKAHISGRVVAGHVFSNRKFSKIGLAFGGEYEWFTYFSTELELGANTINLDVPGLFGVNDRLWFFELSGIPKLIIPFTINDVRVVPSLGARAGISPSLASSTRHFSFGAHYGLVLGTKVDITRRFAIVATSNLQFGFRNSQPVAFLPQLDFSLGLSYYL